jgi:hypothetical protein
MSSLNPLRIQGERKMGKTRQHHQSSYSIRLKNGRSVPLKVITSLQTAANRIPSLLDNPEVSTREIDFVRFPNGALADLVRDSSGDPAFVVFRDGKSTFHRTLKDGAVTLVPPRMHRSILEAVCLPNSIELGCTPRGLLKDIDEVLENYADFRTRTRLNNNERMMHIVLNIGNP